MSRLQEIADQFKQRGSEYWEKIKETEIYQKADEKYHSLSPQGQKFTRYGAVVFVIFMLMFYPLSQLQVSSAFISEFETKREILRDLFKTYRESSATAILPPPPVGSDLVSQINSLLSTAELLPEQIISVTPIEPEGQLIPKKLVNSVVSVQLANLNLKQAVDIGAQLGNISGAIKLKDLTMNASTEKVGYFEVTYKLYALNVPQPIVEAVPEAEPAPKNGRNKKLSTETEE